MNYLLGLDIGTSGVKALLISVEGKIISSKTESYPLATPHSGWAEQSPDDWWEATVKAIKETVSGNPINSSQIKGISLSGQMHSSVFLDEKMAIRWQLLDRPSSGVIPVPWNNVKRFIL